MRNEDLMGAAKPVSQATWDHLHQAAVAAMKKSYSPYSNYPVGAAALVEDGRVVSGCNIENASYGVTLCAECSLISELIMTGGGKLIAFACVNAQEEDLAPCGRCRQLLWEHGGPRLQLAMPGGQMTMDMVLPGAFGPDDLDEIKKELAEEENS